MESTTTKNSTALRVSRHCERVGATGAKRVEVTVPTQDAPLVKAIARALRSGGGDAEMVRNALQPVLVIGRATTGAELVAFLRASPIAEIGLEIERDCSTGRSVDLG